MRPASTSPAAEPWQQGRRLRQEVRRRRRRSPRRAGSQGVKTDRGSGFTTDWFGAFASVGVQFTFCRLVRLLVYPLDVGSYLVAEGTGGRSASAAVRYGGAL